MMNQERYQRLSRWLNLFPAQVIDTTPDLQMRKARFAKIQRLDLIELNEIEAKLADLLEGPQHEPEIVKYLQAEINALRSVQYYYAIDPERSVASCKAALELLPLDWYALRTYCWLYGTVRSKCQEISVRLTNGSTAAL